MLPRVLPAPAETVMIIEIKPEQQKVLDRAARSGMSTEDVLDQAFAVIDEQYREDDWMLAEKQSIAVQIEEGFAQSERGELLDADLAIKALREGRTTRRIA
jgi:hypothetical protein